MGALARGRPDEPVRALVRWLRRDEGGRSVLPTSGRYRSVIRFDDDPNSKLGFWDVEVRLDDAPRYGADVPAIVSFPVDGAPQTLLCIGGGFELSEGPRVVARGRIVS